MTVWFAEIDGGVTSDEALKTAETILDVQLPNGMIPWFEGGHGDPWNHIEAAMALDLCGFRQAAERAYEWLEDTQHTNGAWHQYYLADGVEEARLDANCVAYVATGVWHHFLLTKDRGFLEALWPIVDRAMEFVLSLQTQRGEIIWACRSDGTKWSFALLTGSSSVYHSLGMALASAEELGLERPEWEEGRQRLGKVIRHQPEAFTPKKRWAMDWYYPVLSGAITGSEGLEHLRLREKIFVEKNRGVRCVSDRPWITAAETAECAMAYLRAGDEEMAQELFLQTAQFRSENGAYFTGFVYPDQQTYPEAEKTSYTAGAVLLAADALTQTSPASHIFVNTAKEANPRCPD